jgi:hypothetical protein
MKLELRQGQCLPQASRASLGICHGNVYVCGGRQTLENHKFYIDKSLFVGEYFTTMKKNYTKIYVNLLILFWK